MLYTALLAFALVCEDVRKFYDDHQCCYSPGDTPISVDCAPPPPQTAWSFGSQTQSSTVSDSMPSTVRYHARTSDMQRPEMLSTYAPFAVEQFPFNMLQPTFPGVADDKHVYLVLERADEAEPLQDPSNTIGGINYFPWIGLFGSHNWMQTSTSLIVKVDRGTGKAVLARPLGNITGIPSTDLRTFEGTGADMTRGPMVIHGDSIYTTIQSYKYAGVVKFSKHTFELEASWYLGQLVNKDLPPNAQYHIQMRQVTVVPPAVEGGNPMIVAGASGGMSYGQIVQDNLVKLKDYFTATGALHILEDQGDKLVERHTINSVARPYVSGDMLEATSFGTASDTTAVYVPLTEGMDMTELSSTTPGLAGHQRLIYSIVRNPDPGTVLIRKVLEAKATEFVIPPGPFSATQLYTSVDGTITVPGSTFLASGSVGIEQVVAKTLHKDHIGVYKIPTAQEATALSHFGGGFYGNFVVDAASRRIYAGTGNNYGRPIGEIRYVYERWGVPYHAASDAGVVVPDSASGGVLLNPYLGRYDESGQTMAEYDALAEEYWRNFDDFLDPDDPANDLGARSNRAFYDTLFGVNVDTGTIEFAVRGLGGDDTEDHDISSAFVGGTPVMSQFMPNGKNEDMTHGAHFFEVNSTGIDGLDADPGKEVTATVLVTVTKSGRMQAFDLKRLPGTLEHVAGDATPDFAKGVAKNRFTDAMLFQQRDQLFSQGTTTFVGTTSDGASLVVRSHESGFANGIKRIKDKTYRSGVAALASGASKTVVWSVDVEETLRTKKMSYKWVYDTPASHYMDNGSIQQVGDAILVGDGINAVHVIDARTGVETSELNVVGGSPASTMFLDSQVFVVPGNTKWVVNEADKVVATHMVTFTPYGK